jgi:hypothetical protein
VNDYSSYAAPYVGASPDAPSGREGVLQERFARGLAHHFIQSHMYFIKARLPVSVRIAVNPDSYTAAIIERF